ncbi:hypothetical protein NEIFL0001_1323 [Neisseria flavescens SK114]|nr:hypothetical protein NEIFL0001_1323 [Neisseria flavescens SK114]
MKPFNPYKEKKVEVQPSSGGCVLKQNLRRKNADKSSPAVFGRLCVETCLMMKPLRWLNPAVFGRLCVETWQILEGVAVEFSQPSSGGCVLKHVPSDDLKKTVNQPSSGGCVLKLTQVLTSCKRLASRLRAAVC